MGEEELNEASHDASLKAESLKPEIGPSEFGEGTALNSRTRHLLQRSVIYGLLLILVAITVNDFRHRKAWELEYQTLSDSLIHSKGLPQETSSPELVKMMLSRKGVDTWLDDRGYTLSEDNSSNKLRVYAKSSGFREFWLVVDYHVGGTEQEPVLTTINFTPESYYFWEVPGKQPVQAKASRVPSNPASEGGGTTVEGGTPMGGGMGMGGSGSGQRGRGGRGDGGQRGEINPEERFNEMDTNGDDTLTDDEFSDRLRDNLERFDSDRDGQIAKNEFLEAMAAILARVSQNGNRQSRNSEAIGGPGSPGGGGLYDVPDDPGEEGEEDVNRLPDG